MNKQQRINEYNSTQKWLDKASNEDISEMNDQAKDLLLTISRVHNTERCNKFISILRHDNFVANTIRKVFSTNIGTKIAIILGIRCNSKLVISGVHFDDENSERIVETECLNRGHFDFF